GKIGIKDGVRAEDIGGALTIGDDVDVSMNIAKLMVPGLVPLSAAIGAKGALGELLSVTARVAGAGGALIVASEGSVDPLAGVGTLSATLHPVVFTRGVRAPADLVPALKGIVTDGSGTVAGSAKLSLSPSGMTSEGVLSLRDLTLAKDGMIARGIDGEIRFCDLIPLRSPAGQKLAIDEIVAGVRLTDGSVSFGIEEGPVLAVSRTLWHWAGGMLATEPMTITKGAPVSVTLKAADLDLPQVLELAKIKGLASTGLLAGKLPLRVFEGRMEIDGGKLYSLGGGHLSYDPNDPPAFLKEGAGAHMNILRDALRNLDYESLRITIDGATDGEQKVIMTVRGVNPDFFDGRPVSLTINLSGALHSVVSRGLGTGTVGKDIRQQFEMIEER
ncbi:MAG: YdbH domain-containing protein, partial [Pseudomonadota bacterium]|nr:YdbH domain-containing protein [Pseudomonadota bacterium]